MLRTPWIVREFQFDFPEGWIFNIMERLRGTAPRMIDITSSINEQASSLRHNNKWSIKEELGHLVDLEDLHIQRLREFNAKLKTLSAADMSNAQTKNSNHNETSVIQHITNFSSKRNELISLLENMDEETHFHKSIHPRLNILMRPVDVAYFAAEHDDHHIASIREIVKLG